MIEINGTAHTIIAVSDFETCKAFYHKLMPFLGLTCVFDGDDYIYYVGGRTALGIGRCDPQFEGQRFVQNSIGLHHLCFRARKSEDVDALHEYLLSIDAEIVHAPEPGGWAPGYYSVLFEDPVGTRLELNFVPGKGVLAGDGV
ncbi:MAG: VOC family protein, partial [Gammaproteobacteria bacterium]